MNIQPIVEGYGEVEALPVLLRRLRDITQAFGVRVNPPIRKPRSKLVDERQLRIAVQLARVSINCGAILILFDGDDDCPAEKAPQIQAWASEESAPIPCFVVVARREFEAWLLASIESLRGVRGITCDAVSHPNPESVNGAKEQLDHRMQPRRSYSETIDQAALTAKIDLASVHRRCRSFRRLIKVYTEIIVALGENRPESWPPEDWLPR